MKIRSVALCLVTVIVLVSCFTPETGPPIILDAEQQLVIENGTYYYEITESDTFLHYHLEYYTTRDSCAQGDYSIEWQNGLGVRFNVTYAYPVWEYAGTWYEIDRQWPVGKTTMETGGDPIFTLEAYNGVTTLTARDTLELVTGDQ